VCVCVCTRVVLQLFVCVYSLVCLCVCLFVCVILWMCAVVHVDFPPFSWTWRTTRVNASQWGNTALIRAARNGHTPCAQALIEAKADLNAKTNVSRGSLVDISSCSGLLWGQQANLWSVLLFLLFFCFLSVISVFKVI